MLKAEEITLDLSELEGIDEATQEEMSKVAGESGRLILGELGFSDSDMFSVVDSRAAEWSSYNSADLVTQISDVTKEKLQKAISLGIAQGVSRETLIEDIMSGYSFSEERATLIADTEIGFANSAGSLMGLEEAQKAGVDVKKSWDATFEPCPVCQENQDAGPIPLDQAFPSGDDFPLAHPNCRCVLNGETD